MENRRLSNKELWIKKSMALIYLISAYSLLTLCYSYAMSNITIVTYRISPFIWGGIGYLIFISINRLFLRNVVSFKLIRFFDIVTFLMLLCTTLTGLKLVDSFIQIAYNVIFNMIEILARFIIFLGL